MDSDPRARTAARLAEIADDPGWSPVLRIEAKYANHHGIVLDDLTDEAVRDALRARIWARADRPSTGEDDLPRLRQRLAELRARTPSPRPVRWRMRWLALWAAIVQLATGRHAYIATSCLHGDCSHCCSGQRLDGGPKRPTCCKWCERPCRCPSCRAG